jgi:hypothetical protein
MDAPTDDVTVDFDAIDKLVAEGKTNGAATAPADDKTDEIVVAPAEPVAKTTPKPVVTPEEGIEKLKEQLKASETARIASETARQAAEQRERDTAQAEAAARGEVQKTQLDIVNGAIERVTQAGDQLEAKYAELMAAQDWAGAAKIQREMSNNAAELQTLKNGKVQMEKAPKPQPRAPVDRVEAFAAQLSAPSAAWVRAHPEFVNDAAKNRQMLAAHELALARGVKADSEDYFKSIERTLDIEQPLEVDTTAADDPMAVAASSPVTTSRRTGPPAAPVSRQARDSSGRNPNVVTLSADEREMATLMFPDSKTPEVEYARNKMALKREGKLQ